MIYSLYIQIKYNFRKQITVFSVVFEICFAGEASLYHIYRYHNETGTAEQRDGQKMHG